MFLSTNDNLKLSLSQEQSSNQRLGLLDSLKTEVARPPNWYLLVTFQEAGSGAECASVVFPLVNCLSIHEDLFAGGARCRDSRVGERGLCRFGFIGQGENRPNL